MDRLDFQAALSYDINVGGMEMLIKAVRAKCCERLIMTSTSNVCSDLTRTENRTMLDESAPYATRETSPHHYGWTKALSEQIALKANGSKLSNGRELQSTVVRPCGAVVAGDDVLTYTRVLDLGMFTSMGSWTSNGCSAPHDY